MSNSHLAISSNLLHVSCPLHHVEWTNLKSMHTVSPFRSLNGKEKETEDIPPRVYVDIGGRWGRGVGCLAEGSSIPNA